MTNQRKESFRQEMTSAHTYKGRSVLLGAAMLDGEAQSGNLISLPLKTVSRHGLIAGATGTGKTKSLQVFAEGLSDLGIPVMLMDIKGDLSGLAAPGNPHPKIDERHAMIGEAWNASSYPVELLSISGEPGVRLRATISEFGPVLLSKMLELNDHQSGVVSVVFKYCDDHKLPLLDIKDFRSALQYLTNEGAEEISDYYGKLNPSSVTVILRKLIELESQGGDLFFGEYSFDVEDLLRQDRDGRGVIHILRLTDIQARPKLFSTFMLSLLAEIFEKFPEAGDAKEPKLVIFIDEAHLIFNEASKALLDQIETIIKLIRSKGVGIFFCTQSPADVPDAVLAQLGMKLQHALRAFTAKDRKAIKLIAENFPLSDHYDVDSLLTSLGTGEALVTVLNEKGIPTPLAHTMMRAPYSRMDILTDEEIRQTVRDSRLSSRYNDNVDRESAYEMLRRKIERFEEKKQEDIRKPTRTTRQKSTVEKVSSNPLVKIVMRELARGILGVMGVKTRSR